MRAKTVQQCKILIACFVINLLYGAVGRLSSIFFVESIVYYNVDRKMASLPYTLVFMVRGVCGPFIGYLEQIFGMKSLIILGNLLGTISIGICFFTEDILIVILCYGILLGISFSVSTQFLPLIINTYFSKNRNKMNGISFAGACVGGIIFPQLMKFFIDNYSISGCFLIFSAIMAHSLPASLLLQNPRDKKKNINVEKKNIKQLENIKPPSSTINFVESEIDERQIDVTKKSSVFTLYEPKKLKLTELNGVPNPDENSGKIAKKNNFTFKNFKIFVDPVFITMLITNAGSAFAMTTLWTIILDFVRDKDVPVNLEIYYVMLLPIADLVARIASGFVIDKKILKSPNLTTICFIGQALTLTGMLFSNNYILLMFVEFLFPIFSGSIMILQIALVQEYIETSKKTMAMVCRGLLYAPLNLTTAPMIGYFRGSGGSYDGVFYTLAAMSIFCGILTFFIPRLANRGKMSTKL
ncbi:monocarboxylate transporter 12-like isoform X3 [Parasteatoda tepidariorum]|uniref:monocarboxylate transporter 12-like isoform X3 n=1 Tax=Parasteatoda tepidariorum TaxID=114398 RepID=UPI001C727750|nr:monocarboxylate transporter 12-like isoform X3 [Parasteatoda tepidariorum]